MTSCWPRLIPSTLRTHTQIHVLFLHTFTHHVYAQHTVMHSIHIYMLTMHIHTYLPNAFTYTCTNHTCTCISIYSHYAHIIICPHPRIHTCTHPHTKLSHTHLQRHMHVLVPPTSLGHTHALTTCLHTCTHTDMHALLDIQKHTHTCSHTLTGHSFTHIHTYEQSLEHMHPLTPSSGLTPFPPMGSFTGPL